MIQRMTMACLAEKIRKMEAMVRRPQVASISTGWASSQQVGGALACGCVHEWLGRAMGQAHRPPLCLLTHLARRAAHGMPSEASAPAAGGGWVVWVGRVCWPYPPMVDGFQNTEEQQSDPDLSTQLLSRSIWVDPPHLAGRVWAVDLAARCRSVAAVVADASDFNMAMSRRLQLAASAGGGVVLLSRPWSQRDQLSAAATRWTVEPMVSQTEQPRWQLTLVRCKPGAWGGVSEDRAVLPMRWELEWDEQTHVVRLVTDVVDRPSAASTASRSA
jgi:hypothetical protein